MKTASFLTGNMLFGGDINISDKTSISISVEDITITGSITKIFEQKVEFDSKTLPIFRYLPFELKDFELELGSNYKLSAHVDVNNSGSIEPGDYTTRKTYPVVTGLEQIDLQMERVKLLP